MAFIDEIDVVLAAPAVGLTQLATDFYDQTAAFTLAVNGGATFDILQKSLDSCSLGCVT